jgi:Ino eighty subunit 1
VHFDGNLNFLDLFLPGKALASYERSQAFLWLMHYYLESSDGPNPFSDKFAQKHPGKAPLLRRLTEEEQAQENVDTPEEIQWGRTMSAKRNSFLQQLVQSFDLDKRMGRNAAPLFISGEPFNLFFLKLHHERNEISSG